VVHYRIGFGASAAEGGSPVSGAPDTAVTTRRCNARETLT